MPPAVVLMKLSLTLPFHAGCFTVLSEEIKSNYGNLQSTVAERRNADSGVEPAARLQSKSGVLKCEAAFRLHEVGRNERFVAAKHVARRHKVRRNVNDEGKLFWTTPTEINL
jgi:hypothetical protein